MKITRDLHGSIDGIQLTRFIKGKVYDVSTSFASYLLAERAAEPASDTADLRPATRAIDPRRPPPKRPRH